MARRPSTIPSSTSTTTAAATFGSRHSTYPSFGQTSNSRPSIVSTASGAPQLTQKCPTERSLDRFRLRLWCVRLGRRAFHVGDPNLVASTLLGGIQSLVGAVDELGEKRRLVSGRHAYADRQLQPAGKRRRGDFRADALCQRSRARLGRLVQDQRELLAAVACA